MLCLLVVFLGMIGVGFSGVVCCGVGYGCVWFVCVCFCKVVSDVVVVVVGVGVF